MENRTLFLKECKSSLGMALIVIFILVALWDLIARVIVDVEGEQVQNNGHDIKKMVSPLLTNAFVEEMKQRYLHKQVKVEEQSSNIPSPEEQLNQAGKLENVFAGKSKLSLKAVFSIERTSARYALISVEDMETSKREVIRVNDGSQLKGFDISVVNNKSVNLSRANKAGKDITLIMYQQNQANKK